MKTTVKNFLIFIAVIITGILIGMNWNVDLEKIRASISQFPPFFSGFIFVIFYVFATSFIWVGPKDVFRVLGAIFFGGLLSTLWIFLAEMINAMILFYFSRILGHDYVAAKLGRDSKNLEKIQDKTTILGIMAVRINPLIPFRFIDLGYGLLHVNVTKYLLAIIIVSPVRIFWLQSILAKIGEAHMENSGEVFFNNPTEAVSNIVQDPFLIMLSACYFLCVIGLTLFAMVYKHYKSKSKI